MKSIIVYFSYAGNTRKTSLLLREYLSGRWEVEMAELKAKDEAAGFLGQCGRAFWHKQADIEPINFDFSAFDLICLGTPVWAFGPAPAVNTFLDKCKGVSGKEAILFTTYGSGTGNERCLNYMQQILIKKGIKTFKRFSVQQNKVDNKDFVFSAMKEVIG